MSVASLIGVAALSGVVGGQAASAAPPSNPPYANVVTLQTGASNVVTQYGAAAGTVSKTQILTSKTNDCTLSSRGDAIIGFGVPGVAGKVAGLRNGSIGVVDKLTGESCGQANAPGESLALTLPEAMSSAVLDIEVQKDAVVTASLSLNGGNPVTRTLRSGQATVNAPGEFFACRPGSTSSAPNSGPDDNCRWFIDGALFDKVVLTADQGQFALEGGSDIGVPLNPAEPNSSAYPTTMTYFASAGGLNCGDTVSIAGNDTAPSVSIKRVSDVQGLTCTKIPYSLTGAGGSFTFNKPVGALYAQFYIDVAWRAAVGTDVKKTTVDYLQPDLAPIELDWCPAQVYARNGGLTTTSVALIAEDVQGFEDQAPGTPGKEFACIISSASGAPSASGVITINQRIYLLGDPIMRG